MLDDDVCRSAELKNSIENLSNILIENAPNFTADSPDFEYENQLERALFIFLILNEKFVEMLFERVVENEKRKAETKRLLKITRKDVIKMSLEEYKKEIENCFSVRFPERSNTDFAKYYIKSYETELEEFLRNSDTPFM